MASLLCFDEAAIITLASPTGTTLHGPGFGGTDGGRGEGKEERGACAYIIT